MNDGHEYDANSWIVLRDENGKVRVPRSSRDVFVMLEKQAAGKVAQMNVTADADGKKTSEVHGHPDQDRGHGSMSRRPIPLPEVPRCASLHRYPF